MNDEWKILVFDLKSEGFFVLFCFVSFLWFFFFFGLFFFFFENPKSFIDNFACNKLSRLPVFSLIPFLYFFLNVSTSCIKMHLLELHKSFWCMRDEMFYGYAELKNYRRSRRPIDGEGDLCHGSRRENCY